MRGARAARRRADRRATGAELFHDTFAPRIERGAGVPAARQLPYLTAMATEALSGLAHLVTAGTYAPVGFFAYPDLPSRLAPDDTAIEVLAGPLEDATAALEALADLLGAPERPAPEPPRPDAPQAGHHRRDPRPRCRRHAARGRDRRRRVGDRRRADPRRHRRRARPRLADGHRRLDRLRPPGRDRRRRRLPGPAGAVHGRRRLRDVHDPVAVDPGARGPRRHQRDRRQPLLRDPRVRDARVGAEPARRPTTSSTSAAPSWTSSAMAASMGVPGRRVEDAGELAAALRESFAEPGPRLIEACSSWLRGQREHRQAPDDGAAEQPHERALAGAARAHVGAAVAARDGVVAAMGAGAGETAEHGAHVPGSAAHRPDLRGFSGKPRRAGRARRRAPARA